MNKEEAQTRLSQELGGYIHLNSGGEDLHYTEEEYQKMKEFIINLGEKYKDVKK